MSNSTKNFQIPSNSSHAQIQQIIFHKHKTHFPFNQAQTNSNVSLSISPQFSHKFKVFPE